MLRTALFTEEEEEEMDVSMLDTTRKKAGQSFGPKPVILQHRWGSNDQC